MTSPTAIPHPPDIKFWQGETHAQHGYRKFVAKKGYNGNMPALYIIKDGNAFCFDNCFHDWIYASHMDLETLLSEDYEEKT